jgi:pilus assembly protein CpaE
MAPDGNPPGVIEEAASGRTERAALLAFAADAETEQALRQGFADVLPGASPEIRRGDIAAASAALRKLPTPQVLVIDIAGHPQPVAALEDLAQIVEPDVRVLVVGEREDLGFYRQVTRSLGVLEYLHKPLTAAMVAQHFGPCLARRAASGWSVRGGRVVAVTGARGGVGATTVAANLAWFLAEETRRHTVLLDADLQRGTAALMLGGTPGAGLRAALENPDRVDELFVERTAAPLSERLHLLASEEALSEQPGYAPGAAEALIGALRRRYNHIVLDVGFANAPLSRELLALANQRVIVMEPSLASLRDALRLLQLPAGPAQAHRPVLVLNRQGRRGGLERKQIAETMRAEPDIVIPDLPRQLDAAATLGEPAAAKRGAFRSAIERLALEAAAGRSGEAPKRRLLGWLRR